MTYFVLWSSVYLCKKYPYFLPYFCSSYYKVQKTVEECASVWLGCGSSQPALHEKIPVSFVIKEFFHCTYLKTHKRVHLVGTISGGGKTKPYISRYRARIMYHYMNGTIFSVES